MCYQDYLHAQSSQDKRTAIRRTLGFNRWACDKCYQLHSMQNVSMTVEELHKQLQASTNAVEAPDAPPYATIQEGLQPILQLYPLLASFNLRPAVLQLLLLRGHSCNELEAMLHGLSRSDCQDADADYVEALIDSMSLSPVSNTGLPPVKSSSASYYNSHAETGVPPMSSSSSTTTTTTTAALPPPPPPVPAMPVVAGEVSYVPRLSCTSGACMCIIARRPLHGLSRLLLLDESCDYFAVVERVCNALTLTYDDRQTMLLYHIDCNGWARELRNTDMVGIV